MRSGTEASLRVWVVCEDSSVGTAPAVNSLAQAGKHINNRILVGKAGKSFVHVGEWHE